jgi:flagellar basal-body rod protein FlgF
MSSQSIAQSAEKAMDNTTYIALSRQTALWNQLEVVANNLANVNTTGFKGTDTLFSQYLVKVPQNDRTFKDSVAFTHDFGLVRNLAQGTFNYTSNIYDLAIQGEGYFVTQGVNPGDPERFTRAGNFTLDAEGQLVTQDGRPVMSVNNTPIIIPPTAGEITVQGDGAIMDQAGEQIEQIRVVRFESERDLKQIDGTSFVAGAGQAPINIPNPKVAQGVLEDSNVNGVTEMTRLIALNRTYADVARLVDAESERKRKASDLFTRQVNA